MNKDIYTKLSKYKIVKKNGLIMIYIPIANIEKFITDFFAYFDKTFESVFIDHLVLRFDDIEHLLCFYGEDVDEYTDLIQEE